MVTPATACSPTGGQDRGREVARQGTHLQFLAPPSTLCSARYRYPQSYAHGMDIVRNTTSEPVSIKTVALVGAEGVELVDSFEVETGAPRAAVGTLRGWPPDTPGPPVRLRSVGEVAPGESVNLVLHLESQTGFDAADFDGYVVEYEAEGRLFQARSVVAVEMRPRC